MIFREQKRKAIKKTTMKSYLHGFLGHLWHLLKPQEVPTVPQQSSCFERPGSALPHWNNNNTQVSVIATQKRNAAVSCNHLGVICCLCRGPLKTHWRPQWNLSNASALGWPFAYRRTGSALTNFAFVIFPFNSWTKKAKENNMPLKSVSIFPH